MTRWQLVFLDEKTALDLTDRGHAVWSLETGEAIRSSAHLISLGTVMKMVIRIVEKDRERVALLHRDGFLVFYPPSPNGETTKRTIEEDNLSLTPLARRERKHTTMTGLQLRLGLRSYDLLLRDPEWGYLMDLFLVPGNEPVALALYQEPSLISDRDCLLALGGSKESPVLLALTGQERKILNLGNLEVRVYEGEVMAAFMESGQGERYVFLCTAPRWDVRHVLTAKEDEKDLIIHAAPMPPIGVGVVRVSGGKPTLHIYDLRGKPIAAAALEGPNLPSGVSAYDMGCRISPSGEHIVIWHSMLNGISVFRNPLRR